MLLAQLRGEERVGCKANAAVQAALAALAVADADSRHHRHELPGVGLVQLRLPDTG